jgi:pantoate kinase
MKGSAFSPGHITGFFEPVMTDTDPMKIGSRGAGINISLGAYSNVVVSPSQHQHFSFWINEVQSESPVVEEACKYLLGSQSLDVQVYTTLHLPIGQGFGMSAASAMSATLALAEILGLPKTEALKASHISEVQHRTGLGDVISSFFGGIEIRKQPGLPPWGIIEHIPGEYDIVLCIIGGVVDTERILSDLEHAKKTAEIGSYCTQKLLENPSVEHFFSLSHMFAKKTGLAQGPILKAIEEVNKHGMGSMCMLGNSVFAIGDTDHIASLLSSYGTVIVCKIDDCGARLIGK